MNPTRHVYADIMNKAFQAAFFVPLACVLMVTGCSRPIDPHPSPIVPVSASAASISSLAASADQLASDAQRLPAPTSSFAVETPGSLYPEQVAIVDGQPVAADPNVASVARRGMAYADFRSAVIEQGWYPRPDEECRANVLGGNEATLCARNPDLASCKACDVLPELSSCSGDGYCLMRFQMDGGTQVLNATTMGMIEDATVSGESSRLRLTHWENYSD